MEGSNPAGENESAIILPYRAHGWTNVLVDLLMEGIEKSFKTAYEDDELQTPITLSESRRSLGHLWIR